MDDNMLESLRSFDGVWSRVTGGETPAAGTPAPRKMAQAMSPSSSAVRVTRSMDQRFSSPATEF